jgi:hypothetical protein
LQTGGIEGELARGGDQELRLGGVVVDVDMQARGECQLQ